MKTIGILGGVGPKTTSHIYHSIINYFRESGEKKYPPILIYNLPFPFIIENEAIIEGKNAQKMLPYLIDGAKILEKGGADFGILPCNTLHKYIQEIRESVKIPFLSIIDETLKYVKSKKIKSIGILATETTVKDKLYDNILNKNGISVLYPNRREQNNINKIIIELLKGEKNKLQEKEVKEFFSSLQKRGSEAILLACTDLQIIASNIQAPVLLIDSTEILINASLCLLNKK